MAFRDHVFRVVLEQTDDAGYYTLAGQRRGPFPSPELAEADLVDRLGKWRGAARALGGWVWRRTALEIVVTLPDEVPVEGGEPLTPWVPRSALSARRS